jgi:hypothetical protein
MRHSLRLRLLLILVAVPGLALLSVAVVARIASDSSLDNRLKFQIVPVVPSPASSGVNIGEAGLRKPRGLYYSRVRLCPER